MSMMYEKKSLIPIHVPKVLYENRYCNQEGFSILICGGKDKNGKVTNEVLELKIPSFKVNKFPSMLKPHLFFYSTTIKSDIVAISGRVELDKNVNKSAVHFEIFSEKTKTWTHNYVRIDKRICYCVCSFMSKLYLIGGYIKRSCKSPNSCCIYDINSNTWNEITNLNVARNYAACTVFEGKIVVTGGKYNLPQLKSVE